MSEELPASVSAIEEGVAEGWRLTSTRTRNLIVSPKSSHYSYRRFHTSCDFTAPRLIHTDRTKQTTPVHLLLHQVRKLATPQK